MRKLYRTQMAELAGITPVQLDYFVRLGAVAPDLGDIRKHYSPYEAALVLIAGQLMPHFKDQRCIAEVLDQIRQHTIVQGVQPKSLQALHRAAHEAELRQHKSLPDGAMLDDISIWHFVINSGFSFDPRVVEAPRFFDRARKFAKAYCEKEGLDFDEVLTRTKREVVNLIQNPTYEMWDSVHQLIVKLDYFRTIAGHSNQYLQVAGNDDGTVDTIIEHDPVAFSSRISWITLSLGPLFKRLVPYIDQSFVVYDTDYFNDHGLNAVEVYA